MKPEEPQIFRFRGMKPEEPQFSGSGKRDEISSLNLLFFEPCPGTFFPEKDSACVLREAGSIIDSLCLICGRREEERWN